MLIDIAGVGPGQAVLDVACGTGIVARTATDRLAGSGRVVGVDLNEAMLAVARRLGPELEWQQSDVADLPFPDGSFDAVLCQMALMFFPDRTAALHEMARVTRRGGVVALVVPASLDEQPAYGPFVEMAVGHAGAGARSLLETYWKLRPLRPTARAGRVGGPRGRRRTDARGHRALRLRGAPGGDRGRGLTAARADHGGDVRADPRRRPRRPGAVRRR